ncbi:unnamed protein product [Chrysoparadoxa australica]
MGLLGACLSLRGGCTTSLERGLSGNHTTLAPLTARSLGSEEATRDSEREAANETQNVMDGLKAGETLSKDLWDGVREIENEVAVDMSNAFSQLDALVQEIADVQEGEGSISPESVWGLPKKRCKKGRKRGRGRGKRRRKKKRHEQQDDVANHPYSRIVTTVSNLSLGMAASCCGWFGCGLMLHKAATKRELTLPVTETAMLGLLCPSLVLWSYNRDQLLVHGSPRYAHAATLSQISKLAGLFSIFLSAFISSKHLTLLLPLAVCIPITLVYTRPLLRYRGELVAWKSLPFAKLLIGCQWAVLTQVLPWLVIRSCERSRGRERMSLLWRSLAVAFNVNAIHCFVELRSDRRRGILSPQVLLGNRGARALACALGVLGGVCFALAGAPHTFSLLSCTYSAVLSIGYREEQDTAWRLPVELQGVVMLGLLLALQLLQRPSGD